MQHVTAEIASSNSKKILHFVDVLCRYNIQHAHSNMYYMQKIYIIVCTRMIVLLPRGCCLFSIPIHS